MITSILRKKSNLVVLRSIQILPRKDRVKLSAVLIVQICLSFLDLLGVILVGIIGALTVSGINSKQPQGRVNQAIELLNLNEFSFQTQVAILGFLAAFVLVLRTLFSVIFTRKTMFFLSRRGAYISSDLTSKFLTKPITEISEKSTQQTIFALTNGVQIITLGILAIGITFIADGALLVVLFLGLLAVDIWTALIALLIFASISIVIYFSTSSRAVKLGELNSQANIKSNEKMVEVLTSYRELVVRNRREFYAREIADIRRDIATSSAEIAFMPNISKYVTESSVIIGAVVISGVQFLIQDSIHAISTLAVFLAAGTRIAPAVMRMQQGVIVIKSNIGSATPTLDLIGSLKNSQRIDPVSDQVDYIHDGFIPSVSVTNLSWTYPNSTQPTLSGINLEILPGESVAFAGTSGAGKTTLVDCLLGVLPVATGMVKISGEDPEAAVKMWPGAIAYVPQDVLIVDGTIRENVGLGFPTDQLTDELIFDALEKAQLKSFVENLAGGLDAPVGERGLKISGGQRQRLGIARAMFTKPKMLVLDEATSSLDGLTEFEISNAIKDLKGDVTVLMIAHRLSTVKEVDRVVYLKKGQIAAIGTFEELRKLEPEFDLQARSIGI
jgi:ABC-type multidrug transport system fused ATPase/permease subunit